MGKFLTTWVALRLRWLVLLGGLLAFSSWFTLINLFSVHAHEGVILVTTKNELLTAAEAMTPVYWLLVIILLIGMFLNNPKRFPNVHRTFMFFYGTIFVLTFIAISYYTDLVGVPLNELIFHPFHGFHSIFTLGTVLTLDFIFLSTRNAPLVQKNIFPYFPQISKVIWIGLSLDLLSTLLIYPEAIQLTPRFYFAQIVVGILIMNGILLSGILTRRILKNIDLGKMEKSRRWEFFATISGAISVTSWMSITFVDFFHHMTVPLNIMFLVYFSVIIFIIIGHTAWNKLDTTAERIIS